MARLGAAWADNVWNVNIWETGVWEPAPASVPGTVAETGQMRKHTVGYAGERRRLSLIHI